MALEGLDTHNTQAGTNPHKHNNSHRLNTIKLYLNGFQVGKFKLNSNQIPEGILWWFLCSCILALLCTLFRKCRRRYTKQK